MTNRLSSFIFRHRQLFVALTVGVVLTVGAGTIWWRGRNAVDGRVRRDAKPETFQYVRARKINRDSSDSSGYGPEAKVRVRARGKQAAEVNVPVREDSTYGVSAALFSSGPRPEERVSQILQFQGKEFTEEEKEAAKRFLAGNNWPESLGKGSAHWLADELLTALRLQEPPQEDLAAKLAEVAFLPNTDPVIRDYIMQHLGHLWEQYGARDEIERALWKAVRISDETTPGTALIALNRGYERDEQVKSLEKVRTQAFELARNPSMSLATRVTALAIAGDGGGREVKELAEDLARNPTTPLILQKVANRIRQ